MRTPPGGTVTFLMTDIEGSTRLWEEQGSAFFPVLDAHNRIVSGAAEAEGGRLVKLQGDSAFYVFELATGALSAAVGILRGIASERLPLRVRVGIHTGSATQQAGDYFGPDVNRTARVCQAAPGGVVLLSEAAHCALGPLDDAVRFRDRGAHRLRGILEPQRLYQAVCAGMPEVTAPLRTPERRPNNLPAPATSLVGRARELASLGRLLTDPNVRLVSVTGIGGVGKTRLAIEAGARHADHFPDGVWFVSLAEIRDPRLLLTAATEPILGRSAQPADALSALALGLDGAQALVVFDSFEHLSEASGQVARFLDRLPTVKCLVTSRVRLNLSAEYEFLVAALDEQDGIQLFIDRARTARPSLRVDEPTVRAATQVCRRLDGVPLAIELAAARARALSVGEIAERLDTRLDLLTGGGADRPDRQRTMRAALDWSYDLLADELIGLFEQLSVFAGGFDLAAAERVSGGLGVLDGLFALRDRSLLVAEEIDGRTRFRMLAIVREYAADRAPDLSAARSRHAAYYLEVAHRWSAQAAGDGTQAAFERLDAERPNLAAAIGWARETGDDATVAAFLGALRPYVEARAWFDPLPSELLVGAIGLPEGGQQPAGRKGTASRHR